MSVKVYYDPYNRVGNRLFQYSFARILANLKQEPFICDEIPDFNISAQSAIFNDTDKITTRSYGLNYIDLQALIDIKKDILIDSYVQNSSYYVDYRHQIIQWLGIPTTQAVNKDKLIVHVRETDYKDLNFFLGYDFYKKAIDKLGYTDNIIVTDNSKCETVQKLLSDGCKLSTEGYIDTFSATWQPRDRADFNTLLTSENILISQSSYSWWAAFLGNHKNIFFPYCESCGIWKINPAQDDINLFFDYGYSEKIIF